MTVKVDVPRRTIKAGRRLVMRLSGIEQFDGYVHGRRVRLEFRGSRAHERVTLGADQVRMYGGRGNDHLRGANGDDHLDGGRGRDTLVGRDGRDRCLRGEVLRKCEVRR